MGVLWHCFTYGTFIATMVFVVIFPINLPTLNSTKQLLQAILLHRFRLEVVPGAAGKVEEIPWTKNDMN